MTTDPAINSILKKFYSNSEIEEDEKRIEGLFHHFDAYPSIPPKFIVDGFMPEGYVVILAGDPKSGKTALASAIAACVAEGEPFAGMDTQHAAVLWLSLEESPRERGIVMQRYCVPKREKPFDFYVTYDRIPIDTEQGIEDLSYWCNKTDAKLIVVDPLHAAHSGRSLTDGWAARRTLARLKRLCWDIQVTALVLHHLSSRGKRRVAENAQLAACAGMSMLLSGEESKQTDTPGRIITLDCAGRGPFANRKWHFESDGVLDYRLCEPPIVPEPSAPVQPKYYVDNLVADCLTDGKHLTAADIAGMLQRNPNSIRNALARLLARNKVRLVAIESGTRIYGAPLKSTS